jgi:hypothetical protein
MKNYGLLSLLPALLPVIVFVCLSMNTSCVAGPDCKPGLPKAVMTDADIAAAQQRLASLPVGDRIAYWADAFIGTPYDTDPLGKYVRTERVVCDAEVDCMYLVFRAAELATSDSPQAAERRALELRFRTKGVVKDGRVTNYDERFEYAEDMIASGKWGSDITALVGRAKDIPGARGRDNITILPVGELARPESLARLRDGDIIYFVKDPAKRVVGEVIGHMGIIKVEDGVPMLVHASGTKSRPDRPGGGVVKKLPLASYLSDTKFIGVQLTRFK